MGAAPQKISGDRRTWMIVAATNSAGAAPVLSPAARNVAQQAEGRGTEGVDRLRDHVASATTRGTSSGANSA